jgi:AraC family transcriptional regulator, exoenzyme S synthesis regulatory protein ExsA
MFKLPDYFDPPEQGALKLDDFTVVKYRRSDSPVTSKFEIFLSCYIFTIIQEGEKIITLEDTKLHIKSGDAFFLNRGVYGMAEILGTTQNFSSIVFFIKPHFIDEFLKEHQPKIKSTNNSKSGFKINMTPALEGFVSSILPYFNESTAPIKTLLPLKIKELLYNLANDESNPEFMQLLSATRTHDSFSMQEIMEQNYSENLTIDDFAKMAGHSVTKFKEQFKHEYGMPPGEWIRKKRLNKARVLLSESKKNISEICSSVGYQNLSHFI